VRPVDDIALFPLRTVLFPAGLLPLRIFEARYLDMVGSSMRHDEAFGVVLIVAGSETKGEVVTAEIGTSARVIDFQTLSDGLLGVLCRGERRFRILGRRIQEDGLNRATVEWQPPPPLIPLQPQFESLVPVLRKVMAKLTYVNRFIEPHYEDAGWVSHRLAEYLPLEPPTQQRLLELEDPNERLALLAPMIEADPEN